MARVVLASAIVAALLVPACGRIHPGATSGRTVATPPRETDVAVRIALQAALQPARPPAFVTADKEGLRLWQDTRRFYEARDYTPAWSSRGQLRGQTDQLISAVRAARAEGIDPELYGLGLLDEARANTSAREAVATEWPGRLAVMETWLTYVYLQYASDLADGISDVAHADPEWQIETAPFDAAGHLAQALRDDRVAEGLAGLVPRDQEYRGLRDALASHRALAARGGWPAVPSTLKLKPGDSSPLVPMLVRRLAASGELDDHEVPAADSAVYDATVQEAVRRFERTHGLAEDGVVGPAVVTELNVPVGSRINQIALNMERWRWLPRDLGSPHILVNLPEMRLDVREGSTTPVSMRVVVGKKDTPTPVFNHRMTYLMFAPYWNVPDDIAQKETMPSVLKDPGFLDRTNMEVVDSKGRVVDPADVDFRAAAGYRFRQRPGAANSLGLVKFMFPNPFNVYLHDTPAESLFARPSRPFSHGCVRLESPEKLAAYVLRGQPTGRLSGLTRPCTARRSRRCG